MKSNVLLTGAILFVLSLALGGIWNTYLVTGEGVKIVGFMKDSPAQKAGLVETEVINYIDDLPTKTTNDFVQVLKNKRAGDTANIQTEQKNVLVELGTEPVFGTAKLGVFVETVKRINPALPEYSDFTVQNLITLVYWLGIIHIIAGSILLFGKTKPFTEFLTLNMLNWMDIASTHYFLQWGKVEGNPFGLFLLENLGFWGTAGLKIIVVLIGSALFVVLSNKNIWKHKSIARKLFCTHRLHLRGSILLYMAAVLVNLGAVATL